jgi:adenine-specific DNA-methyltransferase
MNDGLISFELEKRGDGDIVIGDYFDIYVGMVSGKESVFKNEELGNITILVSEETYNKYIFVEKTTPVSDDVFNHLMKYKDDLISRRIKKFNEKNWYEWGAPRNIKTMREYKGNDCIYIYNLTRKNKVAFKSTITYFGGNLLMMKPRNKTAATKLDIIVNKLNSDSFKSKFMSAGRFKIGHRVLRNSIINI